jgi:hypothetical protein
MDGLRGPKATARRQTTYLRGRRLSVSRRQLGRNQNRGAPGAVRFVQLDPRDIGREAARLQRRASAYIITGWVLLFIAFGFIWLTW